MRSRQQILKALEILQTYSHINEPYTAVVVMKLRTEQRNVPDPKREFSLAGAHPLSLLPADFDRPRKNMITALIVQVISDQTYFDGHNRNPRLIIFLGKSRSLTGLRFEGFGRDGKPIPEVNEVNTIDQAFECWAQGCNIADRFLR